MLGPIGSNLMQLLRVLTPSEIDRYSEDVVNNTKVELLAIAAGAEDMSTTQHEHDPRSADAYKKPPVAGIDEEEELKAKIIPINDKVKKELSDQEEQSQKDKADEFQPIELGRFAESSGLESIGILSKSQVSAIETEKRKRENDKKESTTVFILNQREKLKGSQNKLAEQAAILQYRKNASQEFIKHEISEDELDDDFEPSTSDSCGILVNKKHY